MKKAELLRKPHKILQLLALLLLTALWSAATALMLWHPRAHRLVHRHIARPWARQMLFVSRVRPEISGLDKLDQVSRPMVLVSNHTSLYDVLALLAILPLDFKFVVKEELMRVPLWGWAMRRAGYMSVQRDDSGDAREIMRRTAERIRGGESVLFFPEGTRSLDGRLGQFKRGAFMLASQSGCDVVPLAISGAAEVLPRGSLVINPGRAHVAVLDPITDQALKKNSRRLMEEARRRIADSLGQA